jgi:hypothetical protein
MTRVRPACGPSTAGKEGQLTEAEDRASLRALVTRLRLGWNDAVRRVIPPSPGIFTLYDF